MPLEGVRKDRCGKQAIAECEQAESAVQASQVQEFRATTGS